MQSGRLVNLGNVRLVGMSADDVQDMFKLRFDDANKLVYMLPQDVIDETIKAFSVSATSATGYGTGGAPTGRYFAPANGPDCIEVANDVGDCGTRRPGRHRADVPAARHQHREADAARRPHQLRVPRRDAERVQPRELHRRSAVSATRLPTTASLA